MSEREKEKKTKEKVKNTEEKPVRKSPGKKKKKAEESLQLPDVYAVVGADLSLRRPGFAILLVNNRKVVDVMTKSIDNKTAKKSRGEILSEILGHFPVIKMGIPSFYVREHAFNSRAAMSEIGIFEVVGIADLALWFTGKQEWQEIYPVTVKKLLTDSGHATKEEVAKALPQYLGEREYANDDESDAAAVAVAFLLQQKAIDLPTKPEGDDPDEQPEQQQ